MDGLIKVRPIIVTSSFVLCHSATIIHPSIHPPLTYTTTSPFHPLIKSIFNRQTTRDFNLPTYPPTRRSFRFLDQSVFFPLESPWYLTPTPLPARPSSSSRRCRYHSVRLLCSVSANNSPENQTPILTVSRWWRFADTLILEIANILHPHFFYAGLHSLCPAS